MRRLRFSRHEVRYQCGSSGYENWSVERLVTTLRSALMAHVQAQCPMQMREHA